jgi:hypothetical protein
MNKPIALVAMLALVVLAYPANAGEIRIDVSGPFIILSQKIGMTENNITSIRKSTIVSVLLKRKKIIIVTSAYGDFTEYEDGVIEENGCSRRYIFSEPTEGRAQIAFNIIMREFSRENQ